MNENAQAMLERITRYYNDDVSKSYLDGELDFVPERHAPEEILEIVLSQYLIQNYSDRLNAELND